MHKSICCRMLWMVGFILWAGGLVMANEKVKTIALEDPISMPRQTIAPGKSVVLNLPALPAKPGKEIVLRLRIISQTPSASGCYWNASLAVNGAAVGPTTHRGRAG